MITPFPQSAFYLIQKIPTEQKNKASQHRTPYLSSSTLLTHSFNTIFIYWLNDLSSFSDNSFIRSTIFSSRVILTLFFNGFNKSPTFLYYNTTLYYKILQSRIKYGKVVYANSTIILFKRRNGV